MKISGKIKSVICAMDFSPESEKAIEFAVEMMAQDTERTLYLLHIVRPVYTVPANTQGITGVVSDPIEAQLREAKNKLETIANDARESGIRNVQGIVRAGEPVSAILDTIAEFKADLVIMGNRKHGFKRGIILGSVSERVSASSPVSVLIVR